MDRKIVHSRQYAGSCIIRIGEETFATKTILHNNVEELVEWAEACIRLIDSEMPKGTREAVSYHIAFGMSPEFRYAD